MLGVNDILALNPKELKATHRNPERFLADVRDRVQNIISQLPGIRFALVAPPLSIDNTNKQAKWVTPMHLTLVRALQQKVAGWSGTDKVVALREWDKRGWRPAQHTFDGIHPNELGERLIAEGFRNSLLALVKPPSCSNRPAR